MNQNAPRNPREHNDARAPAAGCCCQLGDRSPAPGVLCASGDPARGEIQRCATHQPQPLYRSDVDAAAALAELGFRYRVKVSFRDNTPYELHVRRTIDEAAAVADELDALEHVRSASVELNIPLEGVFRRTFEATQHPKGSRARARLNNDSLTSEYQPSYRYERRRWVTRDNGGYLDRRSFRRKQDAEDPGD